MRAALGLELGGEDEQLIQLSGGEVDLFEEVASGKGHC
jgi:hypothetical protein